MRHRFIVRSWQPEDGLVSSVVCAVVQGADGFLWMATAEGVARFDGVHFIGFDREPDAALARLPARALFAVSTGGVWGTTARGGLLRWHGGQLAAVWPETTGGTPATEIAAESASSVVLARGEETFRVSGEGAPHRVARSPEIDVLLLDRRKTRRSGPDRARESDARGSGRQPDCPAGWAAQQRMQRRIAAGRLAGPRRAALVSDGPQRGVDPPGCARAEWAGAARGDRIVLGKWARAGRRSGAAAGRPGLGAARLSLHGVELFPTGESEIPRAVGRLGNGVARIPTGAGSGV